MVDFAETVLHDGIPSRSMVSDFIFFSALGHRVAIACCHLLLEVETNVRQRGSDDPERQSSSAVELHPRTQKKRH